MSSSLGPKRPVPAYNRQLDSSSTGRVGGSAEPSIWPAWLCCCSADEMLHEMQLTASAVSGLPPLELRPGYANEEGMAGFPPTSGWFEVVNKSERDGEVIAILAGPNVVELMRGRAVSSLLLDECLRRGVMEDHTVMCAEIDKAIDVLQIVLLHGARLPSADALRSGVVRNNFKHTRAYQVRCAGRNVLLKYKRGTLELQRGGGGTVAKFGLGKRKAVGSGIEMKTNVEQLEYLDL